jgi:hypothetical protein
MHEEYNITCVNSDGKTHLITHVTFDGETNLITLSEENGFQWSAYFANDEKYKGFSTETCEEIVWCEDSKIYRSFHTKIQNAEEYKSEYLQYVMGGDASWKQVEYSLTHKNKNIPE